MYMHYFIKLFISLKFQQNYA